MSFAPIHCSRLLPAGSTRLRRGRLLERRGENRSDQLGWRPTEHLPELYVDEGSNALLRIGDVNLLAGAGANLAVDPVFANTFFDFHLQATTPLVGLGLATDAPLLDIDGDPRPSPWGTLPDLGADEVL